SLDGAAGKGADRDIDLVLDRIGRHRMGTWSVAGGRATYPRNVGGNDALVLLPSGAGIDYAEPLLGEYLGLVARRSRGGCRTRRNRRRPRQVVMAIARGEPDFVSP